MKCGTDVGGVIYGRNGSAMRWVSQFSNQRSGPSVAQASSKPNKESSREEHAHIVRSPLNSRSETPDQRADKKWYAAAKAIGNVRRNRDGNEIADGLHRGQDGQDCTAGVIEV